MNQNANVIEKLVVAIAALRDQGSPVVGQEHEAFRNHANVAFRRWQSFHRRSKSRSPTHEQRIEDLAKGLRDASQTDRQLVGPLIIDYRYVAGVLAEVLQDCGY